jgi:molybdenum cofactor synthesis domain-containing protein
VTIVSTGDELVPPDTAELDIGQVRDSTAVALAALVAEAGAAPRQAGIVRDDRDALTATLRGALGDSDVLVVSAGSSVGARDETAAAIAALGEPGIWCHGLAFRPGKPTLLADCGGVPVIGLPGNPRSALVVFRVLGVPIVRLVGARTERARPARSGSPVRGGPRRRRAGPRARGRGDTALRILVAALDPHRRGRVPGGPGGRDRIAGRERGRGDAVSLRRAPHPSSTTFPPPRRSPPGTRPAPRPAARRGSKP